MPGLNGDKGSKVTMAPFNNDLNPAGLITRPGLREDASTS